MVTPTRRTRAGRKKAEDEGGAVSPQLALPSPKKKKGKRGKDPEAAPASPHDDEPEAEVESGASPALPGMIEDEGDEAGVEADKNRSKGKRAVKESRGTSVGKGKRPARNESSPRAVAGAVPDVEEGDEGEAEGGEGEGGEEGVGGEGEDEDEVPEEPLRWKRPREHHQPGAESLDEDTRPAKKRHVGDASETTLTGAGESSPREESEDLVLNDHDRLLTLIAENKPASQPVEDYLNMFEPAGGDQIYTILLILILEHGYDADWSQAAPVYYYIEDIARTSQEWNPFPQELNGTDPRTLELNGHWRTCNTAPACREFIRRALTNAGLAQDNTLAERIEMCLDLIHRHSSTDQELWQEAPGPERYLSGPFSVEEQWPLTYRSLCGAWSRARTQLAAQGEILPQFHAEFAELMQWAQSMFKLKKLYLAPLEELPDDTVENCVRHLRDSLRGDGFALLESLWNDHIRNQDSEELRQFWQQRYDAMDASGEMPDTVELCCWKLDWENVQHRLEDYEVPHRLRHHFSDFKSIADESLSEYGELLLPPDQDESEWPEAYLEALGLGIRGRSFQNHLRAWHRAIAAANGDGRQALLQRFGEMETMLREGVAMWRPGERRPHSQHTVRDRTIASLGFGEDRSHLQRGDHWNCHGELGTGGNGQARLWVKLDPSLTITDRIVVKEVFANERYGPDHDLSWDMDSHWFDEIHNRLPVEEYVPRMLEDCEDHDNIVRCYGAAIYDKLCMFRLYSEYCPHGDLQGLIRAHRRAGQLVDENGNRFNHRIPERALWAIFEGLVQAVCLMQCGHLPVEGRQPPENHIPFLHCDIKPNNVFLALQDDRDGLWPGIPIPKLGDFGLVHESAPNDPKLDAAKNTYGYRPPEMIDGRQPRNPHMEFASDVWAIGRVMHCLVHLIDDPLEAREYILEDDPALYDAKYHQPAPYSDALMGSIWDCLHQDPELREPINGLWTDIQGVVGTMESHRRAARKHKQPEPGEAKLLFKPDTILQWT